MTFNMNTKTFNKIPLWVQLPNLPIHLWLDLVLEIVEEALGNLLMVDAIYSNIYRTMYACILVNIDVSKGLPKKIKLASPHGSWIQLLDYEGIPFRCRKCHMTGHLVTHCSSDKVRSKKSHSWWLGVSDDHYIVQKVSIVVDESDCSSHVNSDEVSVATLGDLNVITSNVDTSFAYGSSPATNSIDSFAVPLADLSQKVDVGPFSVADSS